MSMFSEDGNCKKSMQSRKKVNKKTKHIAIVYSWQTCTEMASVLISPPRNEWYNLSGLVLRGRGQTPHCMLEWQTLIDTLWLDLSLPSSSFTPSSLSLISCYIPTLPAVVFSMPISVFHSSFFVAQVFLFRFIIVHAQASLVDVFKRIFCC